MRRRPMEGLSLHGLTWHVLCRSMKKTNWPTRKHLADPEAFSAALAVGAEHRDCYCVYLQALCQVEDFDNMQRYSQLCARDRYISLLEKAYGMGSKEAAVSLGNTYHWFVQYCRGLRRGL